MNARLGFCETKPICLFCPDELDRVAASGDTEGGVVRVLIPFIRDGQLRVQLWDIDRARTESVAERIGAQRRSGSRS